MSSTQRSRIAFMRLILLGALAVPAFAATGGLSAFTFGSESMFTVLKAPPPVVFMVVGLLMVLLVVGRRVRKGGADV